MSSAITLQANLLFRLLYNRLNSTETFQGALTPCSYAFPCLPLLCIFTVVCLFVCYVRTQQRFATSSYMKPLPICNLLLAVLDSWEQGSMEKPLYLLLHTASRTHRETPHRQCHYLQGIPVWWKLNPRLSLKQWRK